MAKARTPADKKSTIFAESPPIPEAEAKPTPLEATTLGEWGRRLPIGILHGGELHREFAFRKYTTAQERELEELKRSRKGAAQQEFVLDVLGKMLIRLGIHDFSGLGEHEKRVILSSLFMGDIFALWTWLRIDALGEDVRFRVTCGSCGHEFRPEADLNDTDVKVAPDASSLSWRHSLGDGLEVRGQTYHDLVLQPPRWSAILGDRTVRKNRLTDAKINAVLGSIRKLEGCDILPSVSDMDSLTKRDFEKLAKTIEDHAPGPDLELTCDCPQCDFHIHYQQDWTWDFFFTGSSL